MPKEIITKILDKLEPSKKVTGELNKLTYQVVHAISVALMPLSALVYGFETILDRITPSLKEKLEDVQKENIKTPDPRIAVPSFEALRYCLDNDEIREMYVRLLASSMNSDKRDECHPAYSEIIRQMSSLDVLCLNTVNEFCNLKPVKGIQMAKIGLPSMKIDMCLANVLKGNGKSEAISLIFVPFIDHVPLVDNLTLNYKLPNISESFNNLKRLGLTEYFYSPFKEEQGKGTLKDLLQIPAVRIAIKENRNFRENMQFYTGAIYTTSMGDKFLKICLNQ